MCLEGPGKGGRGPRNVAGRGYYPPVSGIGPASGIGPTSGVGHPILPCIDLRLTTYGVGHPAQRRKS